MAMLDRHRGSLAESNQLWGYRLGHRFTFIGQSRWGQYYLVQTGSTALHCVVIVAHKGQVCAILVGFCWGGLHHPPESAMEAISFGDLLKEVTFLCVILELVLFPCEGFSQSQQVGIGPNTVSYM